MISDAFQAHLNSGATTLARAWAVTRRDGTMLGFTDHDRDLAFEGITFRAGTGMSARALAQSSGLAVDNTEAAGALSDAGITEDDIRAGRYDGAGIRIWLVNWADVAMRRLQFAGELGELRRRGAAFEAELRGLSERLNTEQGFLYQRPCAAILGDARCRFDLATPGFTTERTVARVEGRRVFRFAGMQGFAAGWFAFGRLLVLEGPAAGEIAVIKNDRAEDGVRVIELWQALGGEIIAGARVRLEAGCDKALETCRLKFDNVHNFRGFPHLPGEDWLTSYPVQGGGNDGGSLQ